MKTDAAGMQMLEDLSEKFVWLEWDYARHTFQRRGDTLDYQLFRGAKADHFPVRAEKKDVSAGDLPRLQEFLDRVLHDPGRAAGIFRLRTAKNGLCWSRIAGVSSRAEDGSLILIECQVYDLEPVIRYQRSQADIRNKLRSLVNSIPAGIAIYQFQGSRAVPIFYSEAACQILGIDPRVSEGSSVPPDLLPAAVLLSGQNASRLAAGQSVETRVKINRADSRAVCLRVVCRVQNDPDGRRLCATFLDITALVQQEHEKNWREECIRLLSETEGMTTFDYDALSDCLRYSIYTARNGHQENVIQSMPAYLTRYAAQHPDCPDFTRLLREISQKPSLKTFDFQMDRLDVGPRWSRAVCKSFFGEDGKLSRIIGRIDDIQEEKDYERALVEKESVFRRLITTGAFLSIEYDLTTGMRVESGGDVLPEGVPDAIPLVDLIALGKKLVHPDDRPILEPFSSASDVWARLSSRNGRTGFDCRMRAVSGQYEGYRWIGFTLIYAANPQSGHEDVCFYAVDIQNKKEKELGLLEQARRDSLTSLLNRGAIEHYCAGCGCRSGSGAFLIIDLDDFKRVNEVFGHMFGDKMLRTVAVTLQAAARECDVCARAGGDEFMVCIREYGDETVLRERVRILNAALVTRLSDDLTLTASIGVAVCPFGEAVFEKQVKQADIALRLARAKGGNRAEFYAPGLEKMLPAAQAESRGTPAPAGQKKIVVRTFGYFDVFVDGQAVPFNHAKAKELLALLVDRRGGYVTSGDAIAHLWENAPADRVTLGRYRKAAMWLRQILDRYGAGDILEADEAGRRIIPDRIECDLYEYLSGKEEFRNLYRGRYLENYSWAETTAPAPGNQT